jgi:hypothetical protein
VDGRDKPGHDEKGVVHACRHCERSEAIQSASFPDAQLRIVDGA